MALIGTQKAIETTLKRVRFLYFYSVVFGSILQKALHFLLKPIYLSLQYLNPSGLVCYGVLKSSARGFLLAVGRYRPKKHQTKTRNDLHKMETYNKPLTVSDQFFQSPMPSQVRKWPLAVFTFLSLVTVTFFYWWAYKKPNYGIDDANIAIRNLSRET